MVGFVADELMAGVVCVIVRVAWRQGAQPHRYEQIFAHAFEHLLLLIVR